MRITAFLVASLLVSSALAASDAVREASRQLDELNQTDVAIQERKLHEESRQLSEKHAKESQAVYARLNALRESPEGRELARKREELNAKMSAAWTIERKQLAEASKALYKQRHDELLELARPVAGVKNIALDVLSYPRVDGSTSTHPLSVIVAARILGTDSEWTYPEPEGSPWGNRRIYRPEAYLGYAWPFATAAAAPGFDAEFELAACRVLAKAPSRDKERLARIINSYLATSASTGQAYIRLIEGQCDLNLTVREPSADERKLANEKKVELVLTPIARDALVFMVSSRNELESLTRNDLRRIFSNEGVKWKEFRIGGDTITPLWRERNSGSRELFDAAIGAKPPGWETASGAPADRRTLELTMGVTPGTLYARGMSGPYNTLYNNAGAIGYTVWYYDRYMAMSTQTRLIAVEGVAPTRETIASGQYPLVTKIYAAYRKDEPADSPTMKLINWLLSPEGQRVIQEAGYVPLAAKPTPATATPAIAPPARP